MPHHDCVTIPQERHRPVDERLRVTVLEWHRKQTEEETLCHRKDAAVVERRIEL
jgi:hypothetical protein